MSTETTGAPEPFADLGRLARDGRLPPRAAEIVDPVGDPVDPGVRERADRRRRRKAQRVARRVTRRSR